MYFIFVAQSIGQKQQLLLLGLVFGITYVIPVLALIILKSLGLIQSFQVTTIRERRMPVLLMTLLFYLLGNTLGRFSILEDLGLLFYGTSCSLLLSYLFFAFHLKSSLHLLSMGSALGFFLVIMNLYSLSLLPIVMVLILLTGLVASSRLYLNAHTSRELVSGFSLGFVGQLLIFWIL
jgi:membrane-associated phospholipid phosphatase